MLQSLYSGISGVLSSQNYLDVVGNNISNVNTTGYKGGRITFQDTLAMNLQYARGQVGQFAGMNPVQMGFGVKIGSIDTNMTQGALDATGMVTDLAINGKGFFVVSDGSKSYYTRSGAFQLDSDGNLLMQGGGFNVMGKMADDSGNISSSTTLENIQLPFGKKTPAKATESVDFYCNLNKNASVAEEWTTDSKFKIKSEYTTETLGLTTDLSHLQGFDDLDNPTITITGTDRDGNALTGAGGVPLTFTYGTDGNTLGDFINYLNGVYNSGDPTGATVSIDSSGYLRLTSNQTGESHFSIHLTPPTAVAATAASVVTNAPYLVGTTPATLNTDLNTLAGVTITDGQTIDISGTDRDGNAVALTFTYGATNDGTTMQALINRIATAFPGTTVTLGTDGNLRVTDETTGSDSQLNFALTDGATNGATGFTRATTATAGTNGTSITLPAFARTESGEQGTHSTSITVYDSLGNSHTLEVKFTQDPNPGTNRWTWEAIVDEGSVSPNSGATGAVTFNEDGSLNQFTYDDNSGSLKFNAAGAREVVIELNPGVPGGYGGITQFGSPSTTVAIEQDGYTLGVLSDISIDTSGTITGSFSNGETRTLGRVALANFANEGGLMRAGGNLFESSVASGNGTISWAQSDNSAKVQSGHLEISNVDLTREFSNMILAQKALQANAKVVSTADAELTTVIQQLKRT